MQQKNIKHFSHMFVKAQGGGGTKDLSGHVGYEYSFVRRPIIPLVMYQYFF